ncbi:hypothetical protein VST63_19205 [Mycolicibacterium sp. 050232]|uniref:hypothetical protein n=1 Tax=Mycolicibacterium sp. 050232 TaxID=3113982 RepID=UPI002E2D3FCA|nr:hypothetical protein [Mycolicibacterium sp. 050232]MED5814490.1 hypothetical protein [Mycolicibacterium sp. 050232]
MTTGWPWPDTRTERRARIATMYRAALEAADPAACHELDTAMKASGQHWLFENPDVSDDELLTIADIAAQLDMSGGAVRKRISRNRIPRRGLNRCGHTLYRLGDVAAAG